MAPPPSQGGSMLRGEREKDVKEREREREREREMVIHVSFIPHKGLNSTRGGRYIGCKPPRAFILDTHSHLLVSIHMHTYVHVFTYVSTHNYIYAPYTHTTS